MNTIIMHLKRLRRHYESAVKTYDPISLLDLSHSLRIWTELKQPLEKVAPKFATTLAFKTGIPAKKVLKAAKGVSYVFSYMPDGVITYASNGHLVSCSEFAPNAGDFTTGISVKQTTTHIELKQFCVIATSFDEHLIKALSSETVTRCNYKQWLSSEVVRLSYKDNDGKFLPITISREMIIKRVANILDGSHASIAADEGEFDNRFDAPVRQLLDYKVGGLPLPYFILLKIAQDILDIAPKLLEK